MHGRFQGSARDSVDDLERGSQGLRRRTLNRPLCSGSIYTVCTAQG